MEALLEEKLEIELISLVHRLMGYRVGLREILDRYQVQRPEEIRKMIEEGKTESHPAYEDYLDAIAYRMEIQSILEALERHLEVVRSLP